MLNGKSEVYACSGSERLENNTYKKLGKIPLSAALAIERDSNGILRMTTSGGTTCIVPQNLKLEKRKDLTPSDLAEMAVVTGRWISKSANGNDLVPPEFK